MIENLACHRRHGDESDDPHLGAAEGPAQTEKLVAVMDAAGELQNSRRLVVPETSWL